MLKNYDIMPTHVRTWTIHIYKNDAMATQSSERPISNDALSNLAEAIQKDEQSRSQLQRVLQYHAGRGNSYQQGQRLRDTYQGKHTFG